MLSRPLAFLPETLLFSLFFFLSDGLLLSFFTMSDELFVEKLFAVVVIRSAVATFAVVLTVLESNTINWNLLVGIIAKRLLTGLCTYF